jgi:hypothetical protein
MPLIEPDVLCARSADGRLTNKNKATGNNHTGREMIEFVTRMYFIEPP